MFGLSWSKDENNLNDRFNDLWREHNRLKADFIRLRDGIDAQSTIQTQQGREINKLKEELAFVYSILNNHYTEIAEINDCLRLNRKEMLSIIYSSNEATSEGLASHDRIWEMLLWGIKNPPKHKEGDKCKYGAIIASNIVKEDEGFYWEYTAKGNDNSVTVF